MSRRRRAAHAARHWHCGGREAKRDVLTTQHDATVVVPQGSRQDEAPPRLLGDDTGLADPRGIAIRRGGLLRRQPGSRALRRADQNPERRAGLGQRARQRTGRSDASMRPRQRDPLSPPLRSTRPQRETTGALRVIKGPKTR